MISKTITYIDYFGNERTDTFYFNLSKAELVKLELSTNINGNEGFAQSAQRIIDSNDRENLIKLFDKLIIESYGERSQDGKRFVKTDEHGNKLGEAFSETEAYSELFMELCSNSDEAANFIKGIIPSDLEKKYEENINNAIAGANQN